MSTERACTAVVIVVSAMGVITARAEHHPAADACHEQAPAGQRDRDAERRSLEERWGISIQPLRLSAAGYMLDFRYRVLDPSKAAPLADRVVKPYLLHPQSGAQLMVPSSPKVGAMRAAPRAFQANKVYGVLFANPGRLLQPGDTVTVIIGDFRAENLMVEG
jgi:hypothetical protein